MDVYLDTNLWNELFYQEVRAEALLASLENKGTRLVVSDETIYELAKMFIRKGRSGTQDGAAFFAYLKGYITHSVPITKDNMAMVAAEMQALQLQMKEIFPFINSGDYEIVRSLVNNLSTDQITADERQRIHRRIEIRDFDRHGVARFFQRNPDVRSKYRAISMEQFPRWLALEARTPRATEYLASQIHRYFFDHPARDAAEYAVLLQIATPNRVSLGLIRRNIYINWRCAHRDSVPRDLYPDSTHIVNANYCDVYATKEKRQTEYASHLLTHHTRVLIYDGQMPIDRWLLSLN